jgi:hypothetical protein
MTDGSTRAKALADGRRADSARRRQRVIAAINRAITAGTEISVSAIARVAAVDRTFLYRHRDLLAQVHATQAGLPVGNRVGPAVTRASLQADLLAAHERALRLTARIQQLENASLKRSDVGRSDQRRALRYRFAAAPLLPASAGWSCGRSRFPGETRAELP